MSSQDLLTTEEAAVLLRRAPRTIRGYIARGLLPVARRVNPRLILVHRADVERLRGDLPRMGPTRPHDETAP